MLSPTLAAIAALALAAVAAAVAAATVGCRAAGRACYRIDRDAYHRAQTDWAVYRDAHPAGERSVQ